MFPGRSQATAADLGHFEECAAADRTSCENDLWISRTIVAAVAARLEGES